jgi:phosphatidylserine/phosphatidylglycerophosphate/cardiolipin synthase-like enzyme
MLFDDITLMDWIQVATGAFATLTLVFLGRSLLRKLGYVLDIQVFFSPKGGCAEAIVRELSKARHEILVQAYSFTSDPITKALVDAKKRGVTVEIVLDKSNEVEQYSDLHIFIEQGVSTHIDHEHAIAHNKIMIVDKKVVMTGSYNFTNQAEHENAENLMILRGYPELMNWYRVNFFKHRDHSKPAQIKEGEKKDRRAPQQPAQPHAAHAPKAA